MLAAVIPAINWLPLAVLSALWIAAFYKHRGYTGIKYRQLIILAIIFRFGYAGLKTLLQYVVWRGGIFSQFLTERSYFLNYSLRHFWLNALLSIGAAYVFYLFLIILRRYKDTFFEEGETELGLIAALIVGWPGIVLFVPLAFLIVIALSLWRIFAAREQLTTLGWPMLLAAACALYLGGVLSQFTGLWILQV